MGYRSVAACLLLFGTLLASPVAAQAQQPSAQAKAAAIARADEGWAHYEAGRYTEALQAFREAEATIHAPPFLLMVARCYAKIGRLLDARAAYQLILDEKLAPGAPPAFREAQATAKVEQAALELRIPTVEVVVSGTVPEALALTLDGVEIALTTAVQRDPGHHTLVVRSPGREPLVKTIRLVEGKRERVEIDRAEIVAQPATALPGGVAAQRGLRLGAAAGRPPEADASELSSWVGSERRTAVLIGGSAAAGLGLAAGAIFMLLDDARSNRAEELRNALSAQWNGERRCPYGDPPKCKELKDAVYPAVDFGAVSLWSFVAGGAIGVGTLVYGLVTMKPAEPTPSTQVTPVLGPGTAGLSFSGKF
ncbi:tetratricopeptide repeat protein [Sorangium sp. So ce1036]|uniref:tetratricopeptide repeat protein n=1 Tax=Sorangium sp. So ce1036 TaxID=3133328 RepID=UPI003F0D77DB